MEMAETTAPNEILTSAVDFSLLSHHASPQSCYLSTAWMVHITLSLISLAYSLETVLNRPGMGEGRRQRKERGGRRGGQGRRKRRKRNKDNHLS